MIPKEAFIAISLIMGVSCAFGYVLRGIIDRDRKDHSTWFYDGSEADHDRWEDEPEPTNTCDTCKWDKVTLWNADCYKCNDYDKWEAKNDLREVQETYKDSDDSDKGFGVRRRI